VCISGPPLHLYRQDTKEQDLDGGSAGIPEEPRNTKFHATFEDCSKVAAHVHWETITEAASPVFTDLPAVLKYSDVSLVLLAHLSRYSRRVVKSDKNAPNPSKIA